MPDTAFRVVRQLLDNALVDRDGAPMGNVDDLAIEIGATGPPRVVALEVGGTAMTRGLAWPFGPLLSWMARRWGAQAGEPFCIPWSKVLNIGVAVRVDLVADDTPALHWERVLRERLVGRIPGAR